MDDKKPTAEEVRSLFADEYNFYKKWIAVEAPDWAAMRAESLLVSHKYPFDYCIRRIALTASLIQDCYTERHANKQNE
jgi:hypothetical protein